jgi:DNA polymerase III sliding clamp (beta) subunit (PCNA family)
MINAIKFRADELRRLLANASLFAAKDDTLPGICVVRFDWDGDRLFAVATERHVIAWEEAWPVEAKGRDGFSISTADAKRVIALIPKGKYAHPWQEVTAEYDPDAKHVRFTFQGNITEVSAEYSDHFPKWRRLTDDFVYEARDGITFGAAFLALFAKVQCEAKNAPVRFEFQGAAKAARITMGEHFTAMLIPIRCVG